MENMDIRKAEADDLVGLLDLYTHLHDNAMPRLDAKLDALWKGILEDPNHHIIVGALGGRIVSSCVMLVVPNLTRHQRPYAVIENVVTRGECRGRGYAGRVLDFARDMAEKEGCYKMMLMTGSKTDGTWRFYERAGYNRTDKTAFVQWLD